MKTLFLDLNDNKLKKELEKRRPKIVLLQLPEGLKSEAPRLVTIVEKSGALPVVSADPCYGACDLAVSGARILGADLIVHYGHTSKNLNPDIPTVYIEVETKGSIKETISKSLPYLKTWNKIGLVTTVQHIQQLDEAKNLLENAEVRGTMKSGLKKVVMIAVVALAVLGLSSCGYNRMQQLEEAVFRAWGDLEAQLQRRADLVPNLVATVRGFAAQERETLEAVISARSRATSR